MDKLQSSRLQTEVIDKGQKWTVHPLDISLTGMQVEFRSGIVPELTSGELVNLALRLGAATAEVPALVIRRDKNCYGLAFLGILKEDNSFYPPKSLHQIVDALEKQWLDQEAGEGAPTTQVKERSESRTSMLFDAITEGNQTMARSLIQEGVDVNARDVVGWTPLMVAAAQGSISTVQILIEAGADINAKTPEGQTALSIAAQSDNTFTLALLRDAGAVP